MSLVEYRIVAGEHSLSVDSGLEQIRAVSSIVTHPNFDDITYEDDISLIFVSCIFPCLFEIQALSYAPHISSSRWSKKKKKKQSRTDQIVLLFRF
jgi:hypothetical protein